MRTFTIIIGWLMLMFVIYSSHLDIILSDGSVILISIISAVLICIGIFLGDKNLKNK